MGLVESIVLRIFYNNNYIQLQQINNNANRLEYNSPASNSSLFYNTNSLSGLINTEQSTNPSEYLISSAAEIVAQQRVNEFNQNLVEELQRLLSNNILDPPRIIEPEPTLRNQLEFFATESNLTRTQRRQHFSTLTDLFADLLLNNELRLEENAELLITKNMNEDQFSMPTFSCNGKNMAAATSTQNNPRSLYHLLNDTCSRCGCDTDIFPLTSTGKFNNDTFHKIKPLQKAPLLKSIRNQETNAFWSTRNSRTCLSPGQRAYLTNQYLPNQKRVTEKIKAKTFCVAYTNSGRGLMTASQGKTLYLIQMKFLDHKIRLYEKSGKNQRYVRTKHLTVPYVGWSILNADVSPDGNDIVYSTWNDNLYQKSLNNIDMPWKTFNLDSREIRLAIFSFRFNNDGTELVGGATDERIYIYSRELNRTIVSTKAHSDDINAVCFGDRSSNIILSGSDDGLCKVWDRRLMDVYGDAKPVGIFAGHRDGITFIDSRQDDRYLLTNSKDQTIKVWDLRCFAKEKAVSNTLDAVAKQKWDYRWECSPIDNLKSDCSVMTFKGSHSVLHTLIRARFSPDFTGKRYIYTGCGRVYDILTGKVSKIYQGHASVIRDWDGRLCVWRFDQRALKDYEEDEMSCEEDYVPIKQRFLRMRSRHVFDDADDMTTLSSSNTPSTIITNNRQDQVVCPRPPENQEQSNGTGTRLSYASVAKKARNMRTE